MPENKNATGRHKATGSVVCLHSRADTDVDSTVIARLQFMKARGIPDHLATLFAGHALGEPAA